VANLELLDRPTPPDLPAAWPADFSVEDDWTILRGPDEPTVVFFNETHGIRVLADDDVATLIAGLREWGAKVATAVGAGSPYTYHIERMPGSRATHAHGNFVLDVNLAGEYGRRQRVRAAIQTGVATGVFLGGAILRREHLPGVKLAQLDLGESDFSRSTLDGADLTGARLTGTDLSDTRLAGACLDGADAIRAEFPRALCAGATFHGADLESANLSFIDLTSADLSRTRLVRADLSGADLRGANLNGAVLEYANLNKANLREADLTNARLAGAQLNDTDLSGAILDGCDLTGVNLENTIGVDPNVRRDNE
jgi:uncharacterized protein YjbI with pentapeptide repeats